MQPNQSATPVPTFTVVMASYLGAYPNAATNRENKIRRAIDSVLGGQTFQDFELIVVSDGCDKTYEIVLGNYAFMPKFHAYKIPKQPIWSGRPRNTGLSKGRGKYAVYLDTDDKFGRDHLQIIADQVGSYDWVWFNDTLGNANKAFTERNCDLRVYGEHGTSNVCHKRDLVRWPERSTYSHDDHALVNALLKHPNHAKIATPQYQVCHLPPNKIYGGLDI